MRQYIFRHFRLYSSIWWHSSYSPGTASILYSRNSELLFLSSCRVTIHVLFYVRHGQQMGWQCVHHVYKCFVFDTTSKWAKKKHTAETTKRNCKFIVDTRDWAFACPFQMFMFLWLCRMCPRNCADKHKIIEPYPWMRCHIFGRPSSVGTRTYQVSANRTACACIRLCTQHVLHPQRADVKYLEMMCATSISGLL